MASVQHVQEFVDSAFDNRFIGKGLHLLEDALGFSNILDVENCPDPPPVL
jgi:hypothetical protein